jgi:hypothetical protein
MIHDAGGDQLSNLFNYTQMDLVAQLCKFAVTAGGYKAKKTAQPPPSIGRPE